MTLLKGHRFWAPFTIDHRHQQRLDGDAHVGCRCGSTLQWLVKKNAHGGLTRPNNYSDLSGNPLKSTHCLSTFKVQSLILGQKDQEQPSPVFTRGQTGCTFWTKGPGTTKHCSFWPRIYSRFFEGAGSVSVVLGNIRNIVNHKITVRYPLKEGVIVLVYTTRECSKYKQETLFARIYMFLLA